MGLSETTPTLTIILITPADEPSLNLHKRGQGARVRLGSDRLGPHIT